MMKTYQANLINSLTLILMPIWAYLTFEATAEKPEQSITALIPLFLGVILLLFHKGVKNNNKIIAHLAVLITLIAIAGNASKPLISAIEEGRTLGIVRTSLMILTSVIAMITFVKSFVQARRK
ncbi:MAG: hypothetical protein CMD22_06655 [Flavobacteriales bacterium]|nr:hypothetical protein [Flavobacteriales bacterium]